MIICGMADSATICVAPSSALETCSAENMRKMGGERSKHVRAAKVGDSREKLSEEHLAIFREKYADMIRALGYEVR